MGRYKVLRRMLVPALSAMVGGFGASVLAQDSGGGHARSAGEEKTCTESGPLQGLRITVIRALERIESMLDKGKLESALRALDKINMRRTGPFDRAAVHFYRGHTHERTGDTNLALGEYRAALDEGPLPDSVYFVIRLIIAAVEDAKARQEGSRSTLEASPLRLHWLPFTILEKGEINYPLSARRLGIEGMVVLDFTITEEGTVERVKAIGANPPATFKGSARAAMKEYKYQPILACGRPIRVERVTYTMQFRLVQRQLLKNQD